MPKKWAVSRNAIYAISSDFPNETLQNKKIKEIKSKHFLQSIEKECEQYGRGKNKLIPVSNKQYDFFLRTEAIFHNISTREAHRHLSLYVVFTDDV